MKKFILSVLFVLALVCTGMTSYAEEIVESGSCGFKLTYTLDSTGKLTVSGTGMMDYFSSASSVPWNSPKVPITSVVIDDGVSTISGKAFSDCSTLKSITIGKGVTTIENYAFNNCKALTEIIWNAKNVNDFNGNNYLFTYGGENTDGINVIFGDSVERIPSYLFYPTLSGASLCPKITSVVIGNNVTSIGAYSFRNCADITTLTIGESVDNIEKGAFYSCSNLKSVVLPDSVRVIAYDAFRWCTNLETLTLGQNIKSIGNNAFCTNSKLTSVIIPDSVTTIQSEAFDGCTLLKTVTIGKNVETIGDSAFSDCPRLTEINWNAKSANDFSENSSVFSNAGQSGNGIKVIFGDNVEKIPANLFYPYLDGSSANITSAVIGENVKNIGDNAFCHSKNIRILNIPDSVESIGAKAFYGCNALESVTMGKNIKSVGQNAFNGSYTLKDLHIKDIAGWCGISFANLMANPMYYADNVYLNNELLITLEIPDAVTAINDYVFCMCSSVKSVTVPGTVVSIGKDVFYDCKNLECISVDSNNENFLSENGILFDIDMKRLIAYPSGKTENQYVMPDSLITVCSHAFYNNTNIKSVTTGENITTVEKGAFDGCVNLTNINWNAKKASDFSESTANFMYAGQNGPGIEIVFGNSVERIPSNMFYPFLSGTSPNITSVVIGENVLSIGNNAFYESGNISELIIPDSVTEIGVNAFSNCNNLKRLSLGESVSKIGYCAFMNCRNLNEIIWNPEFTNDFSTGSNIFSYAGHNGDGIKLVFGDNVETIPANMFYPNYSGSSAKITNVVIGSNLKSINSNAFYDNKNITDLYYRGCLSDWEKIFVHTGNTDLTNANIHYDYDMIPTAEKYKGKVIIEKSLNSNSNAEIVIMFTDSDISDSNVLIFSAIYDNEKFIGISELNKTVTGSKVKYTGNVETGNRIFIWDNKLCPITPDLTFSHPDCFA